MSSTTRARIRELLPQLSLGKWPTGPLNSLTDVPGVLVHTESIHTDSSVNTGVTTILPRKDWHQYASFAGVFSFNGCGEMTGVHWINETGLLTSPIVLTNSSAVGDAYRGIMEYTFRNFSKDGETDLFIFPVASETFDGYLNDQSRFTVTPEHIIRGIDMASAEAVPEGNTGGGTGMICHGYKGGTGSSSRTVKGYDIHGNETTYTVGVLVQANYGSKENLHVGGVPLGRILKDQDATTTAQTKSSASTAREPRKDGSIVIVIATDAPLVPVQLQRLATRATVGLGKVGGYGANTSGDIFLAFSTANKIAPQVVPLDEQSPALDPYKPLPSTVQMSHNDSINSLFEATADATEEAIYNSMCMAQTMTGFKGRNIKALDLERMKGVVENRLL